MKSILDGQNKSFSQAKEFLNEYTKDGLIPLTNAVTAYKNLAARGYDDKQIQQTLTSLKDAAAFGRQASYTYGEAIQSATEGLKNENSILVDNAGVTKNVAKMWEDYAKSVGKTTNELTQQEKILAEVNGIMEETKFQTGDAAKYAQTFAGQTARLSQTFYTLKQTIGDVITPIASLFIPIIQTAMDKLVSFFSILKQVMAAFGIKSNNLLAENSSAYDNLGSSALDTADAITEASKKAKKATMNYDELNILNKSDSSSSGGSSSGGGSVSSGVTVSDAFTVPTEDTISPQAQRIADNCKAIWSGFKDFLATVWNSSVVQSFAGAVSSTLTFYITYWLSLFTIFKDDLLLTWNNIETDANTIVTNLGTLWTSFFDTLKLNIDTYGPQIIDNVTSLFNSIWQDAIDPYIQLITKQWSDFTSDLVILWNQYGVPLADNISKFITGITDTFKKIWTNIYNPIIQPFITKMSDLWDNHLRKMVNECVKFVLNIANSFVTLYNKWGKPIIDFLVQTLGPVFSNTFNVIWNVVGNIIGFISDGIYNLMRVLNGLIDFVTGVFTGDWSRAWNGVKSIFTGIWDGIANVVKIPLNLILDVVEGFINKIIAGFNMLKKIVNKFSFDVPDWVPGIGGKKMGFNLAMSEDVSLPRLAEGGWVEPNKPRPVIVGDNKREGEIISPESKIYEQVMRANRDSNKDNGPREIYMIVEVRYEDGRKIIQKINDTQIKDGRITLLT